VSASVGHGVLLLADISGYTDYVVGSPLEYAEDVVSDVTGTVVERLDPVINVNKVEGDAAFGYALDGELDATMLLDAVEECYFAFRGRLRGIEHAVSCTCPACTKVTDLDLKFVVHHGEFVRRASPRGEELTGNDVIVVHRLLKHGVTAALGLRAYALFTEACVEALGLDPASLELRRHVERHPDVGEVVGYVSDPEARWKNEQGRRRISVSEEEAAFRVEVTVPGSAELTWELLTSPQRSACSGRWTRSSRPTWAVGARPARRASAWTVARRSTRRSSTGDLSTTSRSGSHSPAVCEPSSRPRCNREPGLLAWSLASGGTGEHG
jgi:hypothetical protein